MSASRVDRRAATPPRGRRALLWLVEFVPAFAAALIILPVIISGGTWWDPATIDLQVYWVAVRDLLQGKSIYDTVSPGWNLKWIYPPIAAILALPLAIGPYVFWQVVWTGLLVFCQQAVLKRCGIPRGWKLALLGVVLVLACEPIRTTLGYGQVNTMLMWLVVADVLPDRAGERRWWPRGALIGLAASIKLTPLLFLVFAFLIGRRRVAITGALSFAAFTGIGAIAMPKDTVRYFTDLAHGQIGTSTPVYVGNQSFMGMTARLLGETRPVVIAGILYGLLLAAIAAFVAARLWQRWPVFTVAFVGLATNLAAPLSWTHHHVWVIVLLASLLIGETLPRWLRGVGWFWVLWISACLCLAVLPYGNHIELTYAWYQQLVANITPALDAAMIVLLAAGVVAAAVRSRRRVTA